MPTVDQAMKRLHSEIESQKFVRGSIEERIQANARHLSACWPQDTKLHGDLAFEFFRLGVHGRHLFLEFLQSALDIGPSSLSVTDLILLKEKMCMHGKFMDSVSMDKLVDDKFTKARKSLHKSKRGANRDSVEFDMRAMSKHALNLAWKGETFRKDAAIAIKRTFTSLREWASVADFNNDSEYDESVSARWHYNLAKGLTAGNTVEGVKYLYEAFNDLATSSSPMPQDKHVEMLRPFSREFVLNGSARTSQANYTVEEQAA